MAAVRAAARSQDGKAIAGELPRLATTTMVLRLLLDGDTRRTLKEQQTRVDEACASAGPSTAACARAIEDLQELVDGPLADAALRERP